MRWMLSFALVCAVGCGKGEEPPAPTSGSPNAQPETGPTSGGGLSAQQKAEALFGSQCAMCHGADGKGDGPGAAQLNPKPRNYTDPAWQASVTDDQIKQTIVLGGMKVGKSGMMPANPQLQRQPEVLDGLVKIIRGFGKK
ncbi:MAG TPA: c-type cytochrome [Kofleriaceae bacterium]|nr:c-type cytochrome [Kofleriaceae bacterium]